ncbi:MAG: folylpolyglutamate synthase/dihydrofolate synthase family protein [Pseudomonadota bacterium]
MQALHPAEIEMSLGRMHSVLAAIGHPERRLPPVIHIAGTNGKGSTLAMVRAGLTAAGQVVHAYTSPHLQRFHERIVLAGAEISETQLIEVLGETLDRNGDAPLTYFEATTAAALLAFANHPADVLLLEVGLGGRLDATNVIDAPLLTVITPVDMDHQEYLGDSRALIATEKAGIMKRGVPCIVGPQPDDALEPIEQRAARLGAPLLAYGQQWHVWSEHGRTVFQDETGLLDLPPPGLVGPHQIQNAGTAIAVLRHLGHGEDVCAAAVSDAVWPARMVRLKPGALTSLVPAAELWLDGGHNPSAGRALAATLATLPKRPTWAVVGMLANKDHEGFLGPIGEHLDGMITVPVPDTNGGADPNDLTGSLNQPTHVATDVRAALSMVQSIEPAARILICGSLYLAGSVLTAHGAV